MNNSSNCSSFSHYIGSKVLMTAIILDCIFTTLGSLIVVFNLFTIVTFAINRHLRRRSVYCLLNLAVADLLYGGTVLACNLYFTLLDVRLIISTALVELIFDYLAHLMSFFRYCSLLPLTLVSVERVYATFLPFRYRLKGFSTIVGLTITYFTPLLILIPDFLNEQNLTTHVILTTTVFLICLIIICVSYTAIFVQIKIKAKRRQALQRQATAALQIREKRERHIARTLFIVTVVSVITWLPCIGYLSFTIGMSIQNMSIVRISSDVLHTVLIFQQLNSLVNPIIYVFRMRDFRRALSRMILKCSRDQQPMHCMGGHGDNNRRHEPLGQALQQL